ncbi:MAG: GDSL-type esterase/lipase family protein [Bacteroidia bacterium]
MAKRNKIFFISFLLVLFINKINAQSVISFVNDDKNVIANSVFLSSFYHKMILVKDSNAQVHILHIGDSHLQADFLTEQVRKLFNSNAARGLIVPYKVAKTNSSYMYTTKSNSNWQGKRCTKTENPLPIGIGGITIQTTDDSARIVITTKDEKGFNCFKIFHQNDETAFDFSVFDNNGNALLPQAYSQNKKDFETVFYSNEMIYSVTVQNKKIDNFQWQSLIYGMYVSNGKSGVVYNSLGVNGAEFRHYNEAQYFAEQSQALSPDLIIISLGTNEAANSRFEEQTFYNQIDKMVNDLQNYNPNATILLTTPADNYRRKRRVNTVIKRVSATIVKYSVEHNMPYWNLYQISGGFKSARFWKKHHLFAKDFLHYSRKGYEVQGTLLYEALMKRP